jgi:hypothetical protein
MILPTLPQATLSESVSVTVQPEEPGIPTRPFRDRLRSSIKLRRKWPGIQAIHRNHSSPIFRPVR